jgi:hypothetical protein
LSVVVPKLYAVVGPPTCETVSLLMEDAGASLPGSNWDKAELTHSDK